MFMQGVNSSGQLPGGAQAQQPQAPLPNVYQAGQSPPVASGHATCFRCGSINPSSRLYCTTCGDDLSNRRANRDVYLVNGRPVLASLSMQSGPMAGRTYRFHQDVSTVGRTNGNDLVISGRSVSRRHARLWFDNGHWHLEDVGSSNGTLVNNVRIYQAVTLNDGDVINFGDEVVVFNVTYGP
jgi:eukaryotic-like serine/threonine-protein kinase